MELGSCLLEEYVIEILAHLEGFAIIAFYEKCLIKTITFCLFFKLG